MKLGNDRGQGFQARRMKNEMSQNTGMHTIVVGSSTSLKHAAYIICAEGIGIIIPSGLVYGRAGSHMGRRRCRTSCKQLPTVDMHMFLEPFFLVRIVEGEAWMWAMVNWLYSCASASRVFVCWEMNR